MMKQGKKFLLPVIMLLATAIGLVACGPDLKNPSLDVAPTSVEFGDIKHNQPAKKEITVTGKELPSGIKLTLEGTHANQFALNTQELPKEGGKIEVTAKAETEGEFTAVLKVVAGALSKEVTLKAKVSATPIVNDSEVKFSINGTVEEATFEAKYPANYSGVDVFQNIRLDGKGGKVGEAILLSLEGVDANLFQISHDKIEDRKKKAAPSGIVGVIFKAKKAGEFKADLVAKYGGKTFRLPLKAKAIVGKADEIILVEPPLPASKMKASLFGKDLPNGATIKVHTVMANEGSEYVPVIDLEFPKDGYKAKATYQKNFQNALQWCMGNACFGQPGDVNPFIYEGNLSAGKHHLAFHFPLEELVSGYKNKVTYSFSTDDDSYVLYIEFDVD